MQLISFFSAAAALASVASATILQNGQVRITNYPDTKVDPKDYQFRSYSPGSSEISYKGRWDSKFISWWSAPGIKFGFTGNQVALTMGPQTINTTLVAYRIAGQDWLFTNVTAGATHLLVTDKTPAVDLTAPIIPKTFELRVTNWEYGIQIAKVHVAKGEKLIKTSNFSRNIEFIGDSISQGYGATYEGLSSFAYGLAAGLGNTEYSITAFSGICLQDKLCWGHNRGLQYQWFRTSDVSGRATELYGASGERAPRWDFKKQQAADIVIINAGTNDAHPFNLPDPVAYVAQYKQLIGGIHVIWPKAQVILVAPVGGFGAEGNSFVQNPIFPSEILEVYKYFNTPAYLSNPVLYDPVKNKTYTANKPSSPFVHHFDTKGIMQHNDYQPKWHPTDVGHIKLASHLMQFIKIKFGWEFYATGPEVLSGTTYWNDEDRY